MECIIAMRSATLAKKASRELAGHGIRCELVGIDPTLTGKGCGFGLSLDCSAADDALNILSKRKISHGDVLGRR